MFRLYDWERPDYSMNVTITNANHSPERLTISL
jgi:hypothetical protein